MTSSTKRVLRGFAWLLAAAVVVALCLLRWGDDLLIADGPPPGRVDAAVVLQGSMLAEKARLEGAVGLLRRGLADRLLLSVPKESYWGQSIPPVARNYLERNYGGDIAARVDFCEASGDVDSTVQEAQVLAACIQEHHWHSIVIVTSNYHTRRAGMLWKRIVGHDHDIQLSIVGVMDPEFLQPWWRHRESAKIWLMESSKLVWATLGG